MKNFVNIQPEMLRWAIGRAGFTVEEMNEKVPQLSAWLDGTKQRTVKQLEGFSKKTYLPFGYFFLPEPPPEELLTPKWKNCINTFHSREIFKCFSNRCLSVRLRFMS